MGINWWVSDILSDRQLGPTILAAWVFWVVFSIVLHELSHGWMAIRCGDNTPIYSGHMTWNPIVHMGWFSLVVFMLIGIAWGAMPVDSSRLRGRYDEAKVAIAGPLMNILLAIVCVVGSVVTFKLGAASGGDTFTKFTIFFATGGMINIVLFMFNMLPLFPLDGGRIVASFFPAYGRLFASQGAMIFALIMFYLLMSRFAGTMFSVAKAAFNQTVAGVLTLF